MTTFFRNETDFSKQKDWVPYNQCYGFRKLFGLLDTDPSINNKKDLMKTLIFLPFCDFLVTVFVIFKDWCIIVRYLQNEISKKTYPETQWRKEQDPDPIPV